MNNVYNGVSLTPSLVHSPSSGRMVRPTPRKTSSAGPTCRASSTLNSLSALASPKADRTRRCVSITFHTIRLTSLPCDPE